MSEFVASAAKAEESYDPSKDKDLVDPNDVDGVIDANKENIFGAGASKRIWNEVYKVIDSSDVVIQVLDARDPQGTRCRHIERYLEKEKPHKKSQNLKLQTKNYLKSTVPLRSLILWGRD